MSFVLASKATLFFALGLIGGLAASKRRSYSCESLRVERGELNFTALLHRVAVLVTENLLTSDTLQPTLAD